MKDKKYFSAPTTVNLELTELCNVKCRHCYNPWRDESMGEISLDEIKLNLIIKKLSEARVFHVILRVICPAHCRRISLDVDDFGLR